MWRVVWISVCAYYCASSISCQHICSELTTICIIYLQSIYFNLVRSDFCQPVSFTTVQEFGDGCGPTHVIIKKRTCWRASSFSDLYKAQGTRVIYHFAINKREFESLDTHRNNNTNDSKNVEDELQKSKLLCSLVLRQWMLLISFLHQSLH